MYEQESIDSSKMHEYGRFGIWLEWIAVTQLGVVFVTRPFKPCGEQWTLFHVGFALTRMQRSHMACNPVSYPIGLLQELAAASA